MKRAGLAHANLTKTHRTISILGMASPGDRVLLGPTGRTGHSSGQPVRIADQR